jgi:hypothetical protein
MTAKTAASPAAPRHRSKAEKSAGRYLAALAAIVIGSAMLHSLLLTVLGAVALTAFAVYRLRKAHRRWRSGGKAAAKRRAKYQGHATFTEIRRNLSHDRGVLIGTVRSTR